MKILGITGPSGSGKTTLCKIIEGVMEKQPAYGIYHSTNEGFTTWADFTRTIFKYANIKCKVNSVTTEEYIDMMKVQIQ